MPRAKKAPGEAADPRNGTKLVLLPTAETAIPAPPTGLLKSTVDAWNGYWHDPVSNLATPSSMAVVTRWAYCLDELNRAQANFRRRRFTTGSQGQPVLNPMGAEAHKLSAELLQLEDRLGMSPRSRLALGISLGQAQKSLDDLNRELAVEDDDDFDIIDVGYERPEGREVDRDVPRPRTG